MKDVLNPDPESGRKVPGGGGTDKPAPKKRDWRPAVFFLVAAGLLIATYTLL